MSDSLHLPRTGLAANYTPPAFLRHPDVQNLASSIGLRTALLNRRAKELRLGTSAEIIDCGDGVQLAGELSLRDGAPALVVLFHGWEGSSQSAYVVSATLALFNAGYSVFRLNFRDHGDSHHLNRGLFNSTLLGEVLGAVKSVQARWPHSRNYLAGFSLGGNFALRVAAAAPDSDLHLDQVAAVCPVIDPARTLTALEESRFIYQRYFVAKWRRSLLKKLHYYPDYNYANELRELTTLGAMHDFFVPRFTAYPDRDAYFRGYAIGMEEFKRLTMPTTIINSQDDPITRHHLLPSESPSRHLRIELPKHGSHCAFLKDVYLNSWIDVRLLELFK